VIPTSGLAPNGEATLCAWARRGPSNISGPNVIVEAGSSAFGIALYYRNGGDTLHVGVVRNSTGVQLTSTSTFSESSPWFHLCGVMRGSDIRLYVNGEIEDSDTNAGSWTPPVDDWCISGGAGSSAIV